MKQTQAIFLRFNASSVSDNVLINVPFPVRHIHIKSMSYQAENLGKTNYVMLISPFGLNSPWGILNQDTSYSSGAVSDVEIQVKNPITIQGYYNFRIVNMSGSAATTSGTLNDGIDNIGVIVEFNAPDEIAH
jgi:hypothetical protein